MKGEEVDQRSATYLKDPDTPVRPVRKGKKDKQWVGMASVAFANSTSCLRVEFTKYLGDESGDHGANARSTVLLRLTLRRSLLDKLVLRSAQ